MTPLALAAAVLIAVVAVARMAVGPPTAAGPSPTTLVRPTEGSRLGPGLANCPLTRPEPPFAAPSANFAPATPPGDRAWYGTDHLWTMLQQTGEIWTGLPHDEHGFGQKVFWWSVDWPGSMRDPQPALTIDGMRLDAAGSFTVPPPATNAGEPSIGEAMLQGVEVPDAGCWQITGTYRGTSLSFVAWVGDVVAASLDGDVQLADGLPTSVSGQPVVIGTAATRAMASSTDNSPFLVGGWLVNPGPLACPVIGLGEAQWSGCLGARLLSRPVMGTASIVVVQGSGSVPLPEIAVGLLEPIALRVHTHDPACPSSPRIDCATLPVLEGIAWEGAVQPMPSPSSTRPPAGMTEAEAEAAALRYAAGHSLLEATLVSAAAGPDALVAAGHDPVPADQWVWAVVVRDSGGVTQLVVFDYATGTFLRWETPAP